MPIKCGYCGDVITGDTAKYDAVNKVYLHDGDSLSEVDAKVRAKGFSIGIEGMGIEGMRIPVGGEFAERARKTERNAGTEKRFCAQYYKFEQAIKQGRPIIINKVSLKDLSD